MTNTELTITALPLLALLAAGFIYSHWFFLPFIGLCSFYIWLHNYEGGFEKIDALMQKYMDGEL